MDVAVDKLENKFVFGLPEEGKIIFQHPWKLSKGDCVLKQFKNKNLHNLADIGVNDMYYTKKAKEFADGKVYAVDVFFPESGTTRDGIFCLNDIKKLPDNELDGVIMMDVLEHIENDKMSLFLYEFVFGQTGIYFPKE